mmetsp:Transcript_17662/g.28571  ORF Transcript_17662/g.28571 Transcript_17662/m.28571 type:complete len:250 (+) Transcript_17662:315-1064(+)
MVHKDQSHRQIQNQGATRARNTTWPMETPRVPRQIEETPPLPPMGEVPRSPRGSLQQIPRARPRHHPKAPTAHSLPKGKEAMERPPRRAVPTIQVGKGRVGIAEAISGEEGDQGPKAIRTHDSGAECLGQSRGASDTQEAGGGAVVVAVQVGQDGSPRRATQTEEDGVRRREGGHCSTRKKREEVEEAPVAQSQDLLCRRLEVPDGGVRSAGNIADRFCARAFGRDEEDAARRVSLAGVGCIVVALRGW